MAAPQKQPRQTARVVGLTQVQDNLAWLKAQNQRLARTGWVLACILLASLSANGLLVYYRPAPVYYAVTPDLRIFALAPLDQPTLTRAGLIQWAQRTVTDTFSLDFQHWKRVLDAVRGDYTPQAFNSLLASMQKNMLPVITQHRLVVDVAVPQPPAITATWLNSGVRYWKLVMPLTLSYEGSTNVGQNLVATVVVERITQSAVPRGVVIAQITLSQDTGASP